MWELKLQVGHLTRGRRYQLCTDLDGDSDDLRIGDTGLTVFVSPLLWVEPATVEASSASFFGAGCGGDCSDLGAFLATPSCERMVPKDPSADGICSIQDSPEEKTQARISPRTRIVRAGLHQAKFELDTSCLLPGRYRLCLFRWADIEFVDDSGFAVDILTNGQDLEPGNNSGPM